METVYLGLLYYKIFDIILLSTPNEEIQTDDKSVNPQSIPSINPNPVLLHPNILNQTLGELLQNNNQAQGIVMQAMQVTPQQMQQLVTMAGGNKLMNMSIGELFKNGFVQQAVAQQGQVQLQNPEQGSGQIQPQAILGQEMATPPKQSIFQKLKNVFSGNF